jgi:uncharacterized protein involved in exopolysaccharide biosynthesis
VNLPSAQPYSGAAPILEVGPGFAASAWRYKWLIAVLVVLGAAAGVGLAAIQPRMYEGVARVLPPPVVTGPENPVAVDPVRSLQNQAAIMSSAPVLALVVKQYGQGMTIELLRERVTVEASQEADVITVHALDPSPQGAARLADAVVSAYAQTVAERGREDVDARVASLRGQRQELGRRLDELSEDLEDRPNDPALRTEQEAVADQYHSLLSQEYQLQAAFAETTPVRFVERSEVPQTPAQPQPILLIAFGTVLGSVLGVALARWLDVMRLRRAGAAQAVRPAATPHPAGPARAIPASTGGAARTHGAMPSLKGGAGPRPPRSNAAARAPAFPGAAPERLPLLTARDGQEPSTLPELDVTSELPPVPALPEPGSPAQPPSNGAADDGRVLGGGHPEQAGRGWEVERMARAGGEQDRPPSVDERG